MRQFSIQDLNDFLANQLIFFLHCRIEENERMDRERREQAKQQQKQQLQQMQRLSQMQGDNDTPQQPLFGVPKKVSFISTLRGNNLELHRGCRLIDVNVMQLESK